MKNIKTLVIGGEGFIGHHLCNALLNKGALVTSLDVNYPKDQTGK